MGIIEEIGAEPRHVGKLVDGMMSKLVPKQLHEDHAKYDQAISRVSEFMAITGFPYRPDGKVIERFTDTFQNAFTRWVIEDAEREFNGYHQPLRFALDIPQWGIVAHQLSVPVKFDNRLPPIFDFEFYHYDYGNELSRNGAFDDFPTLDIIHASQLYGFDRQLRQKLPDNPHDKRCVPRPSRKATREDIKRYFKGRDLAFTILENPDRGIDTSILAPDGTILYLVNAPSPPRRLHSFEEIQEHLRDGIVRSAEDSCNEGKYDDAANLLCRRNRVKGFLGSDIEIPQSLTGYHRDFFAKFRQDYLRERIRQKVDSYNPNSLSYGLDIPENFTAPEYCFFRYIEAFTELSRRGLLLYDTPEKQALLGGVNLTEIPLGIIRMGYKEAQDFGRR